VRPAMTQLGDLLASLARLEGDHHVTRNECRV
jgi:hypothetical protein